MRFAVVVLAAGMAKEQLGKFGVWQSHPTVTPEAVRELEELGYGAVWLGSSPRAEWDGFEALLAGSESITIATSIVNIWSTPAEAAAETFHRLEAKFPGRFLLGVGAGHREHNDGYTKPYDALVSYLDALDAAGVPRDRRALAALGPKVAELAGVRTAGALPYLTTPDHTARLRAQLGPDALIVAEHKVLLDEDPVRARETGRQMTSFYLGLSNYANNLAKSGFDAADLTSPGSDRFVDSLVAHGNAEQIADQVTAHVRAGADHIAVQVLGHDSLPTLRALAPLLAERTK